MSIIGAIHRPFESEMKHQRRQYDRAADDVERELACFTTLLTHRQHLRHDATLACEMFPIAHQLLTVSIPTCAGTSGSKDLSRIWTACDIHLARVSEAENA